MTVRQDKILKAFYMIKSDLAEPDASSYLLYSPCVEFYVDNRTWLILQTKNSYVVIGADGVTFADNLDGYSLAEYDFLDYDDKEADPPIAAIETTLFVGERLLNIEPCENFYTIAFDHFDMKVYSLASGHFRAPEDQSQYVPIHCFDHLITKKKCSCGGSPQIMLDFVDDFFICCDRCHKSTWHTWYLPSVIEDWDSGDVPIVD